MTVETENIDYYFAYGCNMNPEIMENRGQITPCVATALGKAILENYALNMDKICSVNPEEHYATISPKVGSIVEGVLWKVTEPCITALDYFEGIETHQYTREIVKVITTANEIFSAYVYIGHPDQCELTGNQRKISTYYRDKMIEGAEHFGLSEERINELKAWPTIE